MRAYYARKIQFVQAYGYNSGILPQCRRGAMPVTVKGACKNEGQQKSDDRHSATTNDLRMLRKAATLKSFCTRRKQTSLTRAFQQQIDLKSL